jgi:L-iditol 2-dehydrogenase
MKALRLYGARDLRLEEVPAPRPAPGQVLVKILANGLCGSDIHFYEDGKLGPYVVDRPYTPGHEAAGTIVRASRTRPDLTEGTLVAVEPGRPCMRCELCKTGRYNLCRDVVFMSAPPVDGTFAEEVAVDADYVFPVSAKVSAEQAAFAEPLSVAIQACRRAGLTATSSVAVVGAGPIGLVTILVARAWGAGRIFALDVQPHRLALAQSIGATASIDSRRQDPVRALLEATDGRGADFVFDTAGSSVACALTPRLARRGGVVTLVGWPELDLVPFPISEVLERELDVRGVNRYCNTFDAAVRLLESGTVDVSPLISHRFPLEKACEAFEFARTHRAETVKVIVTSPQGA